MLIVLSASAFSTSAAVRSWTGNAASGNWSASANWSPTSPPQSGDDLVFPAGLPAADLLSTNDLVNLRLASITFNGGGGGYVLRGNSVTVSNSIDAAHTVGINTIDFDVTLGGFHSVRVTDPQALLTISGDINLNGHVLNLGSSGTNYLFGIISGTGRLFSYANGRVVLGGTNNANTFVGETRIVAGTLQLSRVGGVSVPGNLFIGDGNGGELVVETVANQIADTVTVTITNAVDFNGAVFELDDVNDAIAALVMNGGRVRTGTGTLTNGNITSGATPATTFIDGRLHLGNSTRTFDVESSILQITADIAGASGAGITKTGGAGLGLWGNNTYSGITTVEEGVIWVHSDTAFGSTLGGVVLEGPPTINPGKIVLDGADITGESLTINHPTEAISVSSGGDNSWNGPIVLNTDARFSQTSVGTFTLNGGISGSGGTFFEGGTFLLAGAAANTYAGTTIFNGGTLLLAKTSVNGAIPGSFIIGNDVNPIRGDIVQLQAANQINDSAVITIKSSGTFDPNGFNETVGPLIMNGGTINTVVSGGTLFLNGDVTANANSRNYSYIGGYLGLGAITRTFNVFPNLPFGSDLIVAANISGTGGLIKNGDGVMEVKGLNSYSGLTTINSGELTVQGQDSPFGSTSSGTIVNGNATLSLWSDVHVGAEPLTLNSVGQTNVGALFSESGSNSWAGNITLSSNTVITVGAGFLHLGGAISGPHDLTKQGVGTLIFGGSSANTYAGATTVNGGEVRLSKSSTAISIPGPLIIGDDVGGTAADRVRLFQSQQIANGADITVNASGLLDLNGFDDTVGALVLNGGDIGMLSASVLVLNGNVTANYNPLSLSRITGGNINLLSTRTINVTSNAVTSPELFISASIGGAGGIIKNGPGEVELAVSNSYNGFTTINDGVLTLGNSFGLGSTNNGTILNGDGVLILGLNVHVPPESLALNSIGQSGFGALFSKDGSNSWAGPIDLQTNTTIHVETASDDLAITGVISGRGRLNKEGAGTLIFSGPSANTYTNLTTVEDGTLVLDKTGVAVPGDLIIGDNLGAALSAVVRYEAARQVGFGITNDVILLNDALLDLNGAFDIFGSLAGAGRVDLGTGYLMAGRNHASTSFSGLIVGDGRIFKQGTGTMILSGNNAYTGMTTVEAGRLTVNGNQPQSAVQVNNAGTLGGRGTVGNINVLGGIVAPGSSPAVLTCSNVAFNAASGFTVELFGSNPGSGYDQLNVRGTNNLGGAALTVSVELGFIPAEGDAITLLNNDGIEAIVGTFTGLPNGTLFSANGLQFRFLTNGGTGNDVVLLVTNTALRLNVDPVVLTGNGNDTIDPGECNFLRLPLRNRLGGIVSGISATLSSTNSGVTITQPFSTYPNVPGVGIRSNTTPFQISTSPGLLCGTNIDFVLTVTTATNGNFKVPFRMYAGTPGTPTRFNNDADLAIPDLGSADSLINVGGFNGVIGRASVSLHITHTADGDLDLSLVGPDGTIVNLSSDNGGTFDDYGTSVADVDRTLFIETAGVAIADGQAPFRGAFLPEQPLSAFRGKLGSEVNGTWRLRINDDASGATGTLRAWSLFLWPMICAPGGGECEQCGGPIIGSITGSDLEQTSRLFLDGTPSDCGAQDSCPGQSGQGTFRYDAYTFTNAGPESCVTVALETPCTVAPNRISSAAYLGSYSPASKCANYLGDLGNSPPTRSTYSFVVPSDSAFVVIVNETTAGGGCTNYTLNVTGFDCPQPLGIEPLPANRVRLTWSTSAAGYQLVSTNALRSLPNAFGPVAVEPIVVNGKYTVTNTVSGSARFFELRKP